MNNDKKILSEDEHDITKKMLNTIRVFNNNSNKGNGLITEDVGQQATSNGEDLDANQLSDEQKAFMESVSPKVQFQSFKIYRKERNVVFGGQFQDMGGLQWVMSLRESDGLNIGIDNLQLNKDNLTVLNKLHGYYLNWSNDWAVKLNTEYKFQGE